MPPHAPPWANDLPPELRAGAVESSASLTELFADGNTPAFLNPCSIEINAAWCSLPKAGVSALLELASWLKHEPASRPTLELAWHIWRLLFPCPVGSAGAIQAEYGPTPAAALLPPLLPTAGEQTPTLYLLLLLGGVDQLLAQHARRGIPERVTRDSLSDVTVWTRAHYTGGLNPLSTRDGLAPRGGVWGLDNLGWPMRTLSGELLRIGRLQHRLDTYTQPFSIYRERRSERVCIVCSEAGLAFNSSGLRCGADDTDDVWYSEHVEQEEQPDSSLLVTGIDSSGVAIREPLQLTPLSDWELLLSPGDKVCSLWSVRNSCIYKQ
jgi:hypothetical protein